MMTVSELRGLVNDIIEEAIFHGGSPGGNPYFSNAGSLEVAVSTLADTIGCDYEWDNESEPHFIRLIKADEEAERFVHLLPAEVEKYGQELHKEDKDIIKYELYGTLNPDGDFRVAVAEFEQPKFRRHIKYDVDCEEWKISLVTTDPYYVRDFLEELIVSYRTHSHYWVLPKLYSMTEAVLNSVFDNKKSCERQTMSGNYEGTELVLKKSLEEGGKNGSEL